jgi:hypothetical protein
MCDGDNLILGSGVNRLNGLAGEITLFPKVPYKGNPENINENKKIRITYGTCDWK